MPSSACARDHPALHSFPTRRSSDLMRHHVRKFRSESECQRGKVCFIATARKCAAKWAIPSHAFTDPAYRLQLDFRCELRASQRRQLRSEEHTSELQSHVNLVCRLLLVPATTQLYTLSLHDALPISCVITSGNFEARASANAEKFASLPPLVNVPLNGPFHPTRSPIQRTVSNSIFDASCERASVAN